MVPTQPLKPLTCYGDWSTNTNTTKGRRCSNMFSSDDYLSWRASSCPGESYFGTDCCRYRDRDRAERIMRRDFVLHANSSCTRYDPKAFVDLFNNRNVVLIGDSVFTQLWTSLACDLYHYDDGAVFDVTWQPIPKEIHCPFEDNNKQCSHAERGHVLLPKANNASLILHHWDWWYKAGSAHKHLSKVKDGDVVIMNIGLHYNEYASKPATSPDRSDFESGITSLFNDLSSIHKNLSLFFMETTPQHYGGSNRANGYYSGNDGDDHRCVPLGNMSLFNELDWRNIILRRHVPPHVTIIQVPGLLSQYDAHFDSDTTTTSNKVDMDCTHWCSQGSALEYLKLMVFNALAV